MNNKESIDFVSFQNNDQDIISHYLKQNAKNILVSYSHDWDIFAELLQNATDAIDINNYTEVGKLEIIYNIKDRFIIVKDNGIGINEDEFRQVFTPSVTFKGNSKRQRGEKGVGLSFLVFSTNKLEVETCNNEFKITGIINNANSWINNGDEQTPQLIFEKETSNESPFTSFKLSKIVSNDDEFDIFSYGLNELIYILRTRTAIGNTASLFGNEPLKNIEIELKYIDISGNETIRSVDYSFDAPHNYINSIKYTEGAFAIYNTLIFNLLHQL